MEYDIQREPLDELRLTGPIIQCTRGASGWGSDGIGSIARQKAAFADQGIPGAREWFNGTINISLRPNRLKILSADFEPSAKWHPENPEEHFQLVKIELEHLGVCYPGYIYYPMPSTMKVHDDDVIEVVSRPIAGLAYGQEATIIVSARKVRLIFAGDHA